MRLKEDIKKSSTSVLRPKEHRHHSSVSTKESSCILSHDELNSLEVSLKHYVAQIFF